MMNKFSNPLLLGLLATLTFVGCDRNDRTEKAEARSDNTYEAKDPHPAYEANGPRYEANGPRYEANGPQGMKDSSPSLSAKEREENVSEKNIESVKQGKLSAGTPISVTGQVDSKLTSKAFKLEALNDLWGDQVLVLSKTDLAIDKGAKVKVSGTVQTLVATEIEKKVGWDLDTKIEAEFTEKNVVVADSVTVVPE